MEVKTPKIDTTNDWYDQEHDWRRRTLLFFGMLSLMIVVIVILSALFVGRLRKIADTETERYLSELTKSSVFLVDARVQASMATISHAAREYVADIEASKDPMPHLREVVELEALSMIFLMDTQGHAVSTTGLEQDFSSHRAVMDTLKGATVLAGVALADGQTCIVVGVPVYSDGNVIGALLACGIVSRILDYMDGNFFTGDGYFFVVDTAGSFFRRAEGAANPDIDTVFQLLAMDVENADGIEAMREDLAAGRDGYLRISSALDGKNKILNYMPLKNSDLYLLFVVSQDATTWHVSGLFREALVMIVVVVLLLPLMTIALFLSYRGKNKALSCIAFSDPVTGGLSETKFHFDAEKLIRSAPSKTYTLAMVDVKNFKLINETFGSDNGDRLLRYIHDALSRLIGEGELVCRTFADDYALLLKNRDQQAIMALAEQISTEINRFNSQRSHKYYLAITMGAYEIDDRKLPILFIQDRANLARKESEVHLSNTNHLYSCAFYSEEDRKRLYREKEMENQMDSALASNEFEAYLQPKLDISSGRIVGAEALVRWNNPARGLVPPNDFIPFFERNGFIIQIDLFVFEQVCDRLRRWIDAGITPICISVNLSRVHLNDPDFLAPFITIKDRYAIPTEYLEFELTESLLTENIALVISSINRIHDAGFSCSLDDFGSGYSSLNLLADVPVDTVKLDGNFFQTLKMTDYRKRTIIESIIDVAKKLKMTTVAEGIETKEQLAYLRWIHCDQAQGYVISKPLPVDMFEKQFITKA